MSLHSLFRHCGIPSCCRSFTSTFSAYSKQTWKKESDFCYQNSDDVMKTSIKTTTLQRAILSIGAGYKSITNPSRGDMVASLSETSGQAGARFMHNIMTADAEGAEILAEKPRINSHTVDLHYLGTLPDGTLGKEYVVWLSKNKASPDERVPVQFMDDPNMAYVMTRYRETHDLYHTVLGMPTNMIGEVTVKWVEAIQTKLPMCALAAYFGSLRLGPRHRKMFLDTHLDWSIRTGYQAKSLFSVYFEKYWECEMNELRYLLNIPDPPVTPERKF